MLLLLRELGLGPGRRCYWEVSRGSPSPGPSCALLPTPLYLTAFSAPPALCLHRPEPLHSSLVASSPWVSVALTLPLFLLPCVSRALRFSLCLSSFFLSFSCLIPFSFLYTISLSSSHSYFSLSASFFSSSPALSCPSFPLLLLPPPASALSLLLPPSPVSQPPDSPSSSPASSLEEKNQFSRPCPRTAPTPEWVSSLADISVVPTAPGQSRGLSVRTLSSLAPSSPREGGN